MEDQNSSPQEMELMRLLFARKDGGNGVSNVNINAGGVGIWLAVTACLMTLAACVPAMIILAVLTIDQGRKLDRAEDYLQSIFQQVPKLKAEIDQKQTKQEPQK